MAGRNFLFVPGPTNTSRPHPPRDAHRDGGPPLVRVSRSSRCRFLQDLKKIFRTTTGQPFIFPATGTGVWEAALVNTLSPGDKRPRDALRHVQPSLHRHGAAARPAGRHARRPSGARARRPSAIEEALAADTEHEIKAVLVVHNETATGVTSDIAAMRKAMNDAKHPALLYVDGVSSIGSIDFRMDEWGVDLAVTGSQKGLMLPAGPRHHRREPEGAAAATTPRSCRACSSTSATDQGECHGLLPVHAGAPAPLRAPRVARHAVRGGARQRATRATIASPRAFARGGEGVGAGALREGSRSGTPIRSARSWCPPGINAAQVIAIAYKQYNLALGAGLGQMAGKLFRIGHLGDLNELHAARRDRGSRDGDARRRHRRSGRAAASARPRSTGAARRAARERELPPRAPDAQPAAAAKEKATAGATR